ncbi:hypothetical protein [Bradyrhizobium sp. NAS96.2]|uniref:hypothetical protein n=1 Tax=Bradyrhizobium sp. NAS96.2 TaxID=1680160 RepID=UPI0011611882|nr:hypothetical protein [Bradyrhizobium sp. NAS96.2]
MQTIYDRSIIAPSTGDGVQSSSAGKIASRGTRFDLDQSSGGKGEAQSGDRPLLWPLDKNPCAERSILPAARPLLDPGATTLTSALAHPCARSSPAKATAFELSSSLRAKAVIPNNRIVIHRFDKPA